MTYNKKKSFEVLDKIPKLKDASAFIFWEDDVCPLNSTFIQLSMYSEMKPFGRFNSKYFYPAEGIKLNVNTLKRQETVLWASEKKNTIFVIGNKPAFKYTEFVDILTDILKKSGVKYVYTISCISAQTSHRQERSPLCIFNSEKLKTEFTKKYKSIKYKPFSLSPNMKSELPDLNFYILWICEQKKLPCIDIMIESPFYMSIMGDITASMTAGQIICKILKWKYQFGKNIEHIAKEQNEMIEFLVQNSEDAIDFIERIEENELLSMEEMQLLISEFRRVIEEQHP